MPLPDYFRTLGLKFGAPDEDVKIAYRKLSKKFHPDLNEGDVFFEEKFKELQEAYEILTDPKLREKYIRKFRKTEEYSGFNEARQKANTGSSEINKSKASPSRGAKIGGFFFGLVLLVVIVVKIFNAIEKMNSIRSAANLITPAKEDTTNRRVHSNLILGDSSAKTTSESQIPNTRPLGTGTITISKEDEWIYINYNDQDQQVEIKPRFHISNARTIQCHAVAYFYDSTEIALRAASNNQYATIGGALCARFDFTPAYDTTFYDSGYSDFTINLPYSELDLPAGSYNLEFKVVLFDDKWSTLISSEMYRMRFTR